MWPFVASEARDSSPILTFCSHHFSVQITLVKSKISFPTGMFSSHGIRNSLIFKQGLICRDVRRVQFRALRGRHTPVCVLGRGWDSPSSVLLTEERFQAQGAPFSLTARLTHGFLSQQQAERCTAMAELSICTKSWRKAGKCCLWNTAPSPATACQCGWHWAKESFRSLLIQYYLLVEFAPSSALAKQQRFQHHLQLQVVFHSIPGIRYSKCCRGSTILQDIAHIYIKKGIRFGHLYSYIGKK